MYKTRKRRRRCGHGVYPSDFYFFYFLQQFTRREFPQIGRGCTAVGTARVNISEKLSFAAINRGEFDYDRVRPTRLPHEIYPVGTRGVI